MEPVGEHIKKGGAMEERKEPSMGGDLTDSTFLQPLWYIFNLMDSPLIPGRLELEESGPLRRIIQYRLVLERKNKSLVVTSLWE